MPVRGGSPGAAVRGGSPCGVPGACASAIGMAMTIIMPAKSNANPGIVRLKACDFIETSSIHVCAKAKAFAIVYGTNFRAYWVLR